MQLETSSKAARRQIAHEFKERKVARGIFVVRCAASEVAWVGSSPNLDAAKNSLWFQLRGGLSRHSSLQEAWKLHGDHAFTLEVLERFPEDTPNLLLNDLYAQKKHEWALTLEACEL